MSEEAKRTYTATVKEGEADDPVSVDFELHEPLGIPEIDTGRGMLALSFPKGTDIKEAKALAQVLNSKRLRLHVKRY